jgi:hypothetical protein
MMNFDDDDDDDAYDHDFFSTGSRACVRSACLVCVRLAGCGSVDCLHVLWIHSEPESEPDVLVSSYKQHSPYLRTQNASCSEAFSGKKIEEKLPGTAS